MPALAVALLKLMFVLLQPVEDVSVTAVEHSFWANIWTKGTQRNEQNKITSLIAFGYFDGFMVILDLRIMVNLYKNGWFILSHQ